MANFSQAVGLPWRPRVWYSQFHLQAVLLKHPFPGESVYDQAQHEIFGNRFIKNSVKMEQ